MQRVQNLLRLLPGVAFRTIELYGPMDQGSLVP
jgi:hypothetical protein